MLNESYTENIGQFEAAYHSLLGDRLEPLYLQLAGLELGPQLLLEPPDFDPVEFGIWSELLNVLILG